MTTTNYLPLSGPTYPDTLDEQLRTLESGGALRGFTEARLCLSADCFRSANHFSSACAGRPLSDY